MSRLEGGIKVNHQVKITDKEKPLISIITVVKNNQRYLEETIQSVLSQTYKNYEYIIIDGGSKDETLKIIKKYDDKIDFWISEKDNGIYDAFNKGLSFAKGDLIGFVNSDDILTNNALEILSKYYKKHSEIDFFFGAVKKHWGILHGYKPWKIYLSWGFYSSHSTGFFIKKDAAKIVGEYNIKYKLPGEKDLRDLKVALKKDKTINSKRTLFSKLIFWKKKTYIDQLTNDLDKYYKDKRKKQFLDPINKKWIINGLMREMSLVSSGEKEKIRVSLFEDVIYKEATSVLLDLNKYYDIFEPISPQADKNN